MKSFGKAAAKTGFLLLLSVMPLAAQIDASENFTTAFPFYVGKAKLPAGSYKITQPDTNQDVLLVESSDGSQHALIPFIATHSVQPHPHSDVTFRKTGDIESLDMVWVEGQKYGMEVGPTKAATIAAANTNVVGHSSVAYQR